MSSITYIAVRVGRGTYALSSAEKRVLQEFASVQDKLFVCHISKRTSNLPYLINNNLSFTSPTIYITHFY